ncbi:MAG: helix-turn-helix domain-containing protein, partial [Alphaproteobacteria bacterium]|nr:helix-turn-helix domain-containing protein [Alphaproteobacteria bacterium]
MPKFLSIDLRERIIALHQEGFARRAIAERLQVSISTTIRIVSEYTKTDSIACKNFGPAKGRYKAAKYHDQIVELISKKRDLTLLEICTHLYERYQYSLSQSALHKYFVSIGISLKKTAHASEQEREDVVKKRKEWKFLQQWLDSSKLFFIDETSATTKMARRYGRSHKSDRCVASVPFGHWKTTT